MAGTANSVNGPEAAPYLAKAGGTMTGALTLNSSSPASDLIAASKGYVDAIAQGLNPKPASTAATTAALTATYANGSSGVGATLTNAGAMAAFSVDGHSASVGDVILVKDQASSLENGMYTVTTVGSGAVNWVLTRSVYMDTAAEFKGGFTFVINGTVNAGRSYVETATVATVGTDAVTFVQFSQSKQLVVSQQIFTANGTFTPSTGMIYCIIECCGGGGGAGGVAAAAGTVGASAGAGGGGYSKGVYSLATVIGAGSAASVTVGAAGAGGAAGANNGNAGGTSTVVANTGAGATIIQATGGALSTGVTGTANGQSDGNAGAGGVGTLGSLNINGNYGTGGFASTFAIDSGFGGTGGSSFFGGAGKGATIQNAGGTATAYGGGGGGACTDGTAGDKAGGSGFAGVVYITEFSLV